ncbi:DNA circularization protein [Serratia fonticola]|uniref:DNA circularization protein n=1 Tax=Serratia fonticola TaxID=47917 RepID=UPI00301D7DA1
MPLINTAFNDAKDALFGPSGDSWQWSEHLHPASFRGVPFGVVQGEGVFGRRQAVHEYPYRDKAWIEDMGRATRRFTIRGFLMQSSGLYTAPDVMTQRDSLIAACETGTSGTLVHPTLGELTVSVPAGGLRITEGIAGRVFEFTLTVIESGVRVFAITGSADAPSTVQTSWLSLAARTAGTFIGEIHGTINFFNGAIKTLHNTAEFWKRSVTSTMDAATNLGNSLHSTFGRERFGRYNHGSFNDATHYEQQTQAVMATTIQNRDAINKSLAALTLAQTPEAYSDATINVINLLGSTVTSPPDRVNMMEKLTQFTDPIYHPPGGERIVSGTSVRLFTTLSAGAMATAAAHVSLRSYDDAINLMGRVCNTLDIAILSAGDNSADEVYESLLELRSATVIILQNRGASLAPMVTESLNANLPSLNLANRFYQDASRSDDLVDEANPIHPAFMPRKFKAQSV